jgi:hypothetical protein
MSLVMTGGMVSERVNLGFACSRLASNAVDSFLVLVE